MATRGFFGRSHKVADPRLPPGQYDVGKDWPVLTAEVTPRIVPERWKITVDGLVNTPTTWDEAHTLPPSVYEGDIHCVTTWSKLGTSFAGVSVDTLLDAAEPLPEASHLLATSTTGYTTNLPLSEVRGGQAWVVWTYEDRPLPREHGGPVRLLVPGLYFCGIQFQYAASSMLIQGAGRDGAYVADRIGERHLAQSRTRSEHVRAA